MDVPVDAALPRQELAPCCRECQVERCTSVAHQSQAPENEPQGSIIPSHTAMDVQRPSWTTAPSCSSHSQDTILSSSCRGSDDFLSSSSNHSSDCFGSSSWLFCCLRRIFAHGRRRRLLRKSDDHVPGVRLRGLDKFTNVHL